VLLDVSLDIPVSGTALAAGSTLLRVQIRHRWLAPLRSFSTVHSVLSFRDVLNDALQIILTINDFTIAASRPNLILRHCTGVLTKNSRRVGFELISHEFRRLVCSHREMHMVGSGIDRMQNPATYLGVFATNGFDLATLSLV